MPIVEERWQEFEAEAGEFLRAAVGHGASSHVLSVFRRFAQSLHDGLVEPPLPVARCWGPDGLVDASAPGSAVEGPQLRPASSPAPGVQG